MIPSDSRQPVCFVINPAAGTRRKLNLRAMIDAKLKDAGIAYEISETSAPGDGERIAREAAAAGCGIVVAVGGDGTVNEVGRALIGGEAALGIVPCGSGNGLARHLQIPLDPALAIRRMIMPAFDRMDVGLIEGRPFFCTAGIGFDAHVAKSFAAFGRRGLASYVSVALAEYRTYRPCAVNIVMNGETITSDCYLLAFANASQYGNNAYIAPHADLKDGILDLCLIDHMRPLRAARVGYGLAAGNLPRSSAARYFSASEVRVETQRPLGFHVDGEYAGEANHLSIGLMPLALRIVT